MYKIGVIGDKDSVLAFKALGVDVFTVSDKDSARKALDNAARDKYGIILLQNKSQVLFQILYLDMTKR
jgi:Archaeal/vacuolar-type H+-ATPase subunit F